MELQSTPKRCRNKNLHLVALLTPIFHFLYIINLSPFWYKYNVQAQRFQNTTSWVKKVISIAILLKIIMDTYTDGMSKEISFNKSRFTVIFKTMSYACYAYPLVFFWGLWQREKISKSLTLIHELSEQIFSAGGQVISSRKATLLGSLAVALFALKSVHFSWVNLDREEGNSSVDGPVDAFFRQVINTEVRWTVSGVTHVDSYRNRSFSDEIPQALVIPLGSVIFYLNVIRALYWTLPYLMVTLWSLSFVLLTQSFFRICKDTCRNTSEDIRHFNRITGAIHSFNDFFGWSVLFCVLTGMAHFSIDVIQVLSTNGEDGGIHDRIAFGGMILIFTVQLIVSSKVNNSAHTMVAVIKSRYQNTLYWSKFHGPCVHTTHGMLMLFHDIESTNIGIRGYKFFTITYRFIGTVVSIISTYAVVVLQFKTPKQ